MRAPMLIIAFGAAFGIIAPAFSAENTPQPLTRADCEKAGMQWNENDNVCGGKEASVTPEEFYVVQNPKTKSCKISNKKDDGKNIMIGTSSYSTADEAKAAKHAAPECKEEKKKKK
jgi:hypothetical protein